MAVSTKRITIEFCIPEERKRQARAAAKALGYTNMTAMILPIVYARIEEAQARCPDVFQAALARQQRRQAAGPGEEGDTESEPVGEVETTQKPIIEATDLPPDYNEGMPLWIEENNPTLS